MIGFELPPVGYPVKLKGEVSESSIRFFNEACFVDSGTSALALAVKVAIAARGEMGSGVPEVILPAYGCPDLVSAIIFAGAVPVPVDLRASSSWMDLDEIKAAISTETVAMIAVNFLGVPERLGELRVLADTVGITLIEDNAQAVPWLKHRKFSVESIIGDLAIMSFGRGKPIAVLGGGAIYCRENKWRKLLEKELHALSPQSVNAIQYKIKVFLYNALLNPFLYWLPANLPFFEVGKTAYHPLNEIYGISSAHKKAVAVNIAAYQSRSLTQAVKLHEAFQSLKEGVLDDLGGIALAQGQKLLRYPVLFSTEPQRNKVYDRLSCLGLGVSSMYAVPLGEIDGVKSLLKDSAHPKAKNFAGRLLTFPTNGGLSDKHIEEILICLSAE